MINQQEENTLKAVVGKLAKQVEEMNEKVDGIVTAQGKVDASLQEFKEAKNNSTPVQFMRAETVEKTIEDKLNSQLVESKVSVDVRNATIGKESKEKIDRLIGTTGSLIKAAETLVESNKTIKPRKPLLSLTIHDGKKAMWFGVVLAGLFLIGLIVAIVWADKKVSAIQQQDFYWANRAYQAALLADEEHPGKTYHKVMSHFTDEPEKSKRFVDVLEKDAQDYQKIKQYLLSLIGKKDSRDIRVLTWEIDKGEYWILYRFYDEETERSVHRWLDGKVEETTDKIVTDLASAQKYSKRKIWTVIREAPVTTTE